MTPRRRTLRLLIAALAFAAAVIAIPWPAAAQEAPPPYRDATLSVDARVADLLERMTLDEKLGQMTLIEKGSVDPDEAAGFALGGVLSGGGGYPAGANTVAGWTDMVHAYQDAALATRLGIPLLYGVDAVHGHANLSGAVVFPHNVGLGAAADPELVEAIGRATARELIATGIYWNYAPVLAVPRDVRWGRTYEGYGEDPELVTRLALAAMRGLQGDDLAAADTVLATPKHFVGDGGTAFGTSPLPDGLLDRGVTDVDEATLRAVHLPPYVAAVEHGARSVMVSFSSWGGLPMHAHRTLIQDVLRGELGFTGFVVSDWAGVDAIAPDYDEAVALSVNAGIDLNMVPYDAERFIAALRRAVERGDVSTERIDEAVAAILRVKFELGLFERPYGDPALQATVGSDAHRKLARDAVAQTLVLLKNEGGALPLQADAPQTVLVGGSGADSIGVQSGGWTIEWQGSTASLTPGTTLLGALEARFGAATTLNYNRRGRFTDGDGAPLRAELGVAIVAEPPYAEWFGDSADLALPARDRALVATLRAQVDTLVVVVLSGRPVVLDGVLELADAVVAAWLPGTEGDGVADVLFGDRAFVGTLPFTWPRSVDQLPFDFDALSTDGCDAPLFPRGYGLRIGAADAANPWLTLAEACAVDDAPAADALAEAAPATAEPSPGPTLPLVGFAQGVPTGEDAFGNPIGFSTWQDGGGALELSSVEIAPGDPQALPGQTEPEFVLQVDHQIASWGGITHAFFDEAMTRWVPVDLSAYAGLRFWYAGDGSGGQVQVDLFDNRNPSGTRDSAERWFFRFPDDTTDWKLVEIPFSAFARRTDFQPSGAPDDGLGLDQASGWALGFPPGAGTSLVARPEAYGSSGVVAEGVVAIEFGEPLVSVLEGEDGVLRIVLSEASDEAISVRVFVQGDEATPFRDIIPVNELVVFPPGVTEATVAFRTLQDGRHEGDERAVAVLDGPRGAALGFQRRAVIEIVDDDPFDPDLIAEFGDGLGGGLGPFEAGPGTTARTRELLIDADDARPGQDRFEPVLALSWDEGAAEPGGSVRARFAQAMDASHADGLAFWYYGDGSGREVRVRVLDNRDEARPWALAWSDEFDGPAGTTPDPSVWTPEIGDGTANGIPGWGNNERQAYTGDPRNLALDGEGHLVLRALEAGADAPPCYYGAPCEYTSARIITEGALEVTYGRIEARLKIPTGQGLWPAFWMLGNDLAEVGWPEAGEIDIMENVGREPDVVHGTIHGPGYSGGDAIGRPTALPGGEAFSDDFHVYAIDWSPAGITWSVDGVAYSTVAPADLPSGTRWVFDHPFFLILNVAVGGNWPGYPDATTSFPQEMVVDYVRVYQAPDTAERFETSFRDDAEGWTLVQLPFDGFARADAQPDGAPADGFGRSEIWGVEVDVAGDGGSALLDELRWYRME